MAGFCAALLTATKSVSRRWRQQSFAAATKSVDWWRAGVTGDPFVFHVVCRIGVFCWVGNPLGFGSVAFLCSSRRGSDYESSLLSTYMCESSYYL